MPMPTFTPAVLLNITVVVFDHGPPPTPVCAIHDNTPAAFVDNTWFAEPSTDGQKYVTPLIAVVPFSVIVPVMLPVPDTVKVCVGLVVPMPTFPVLLSMNNTGVAAPPNRHEPVAFMLASGTPAKVCQIVRFASCVSLALITIGVWFCAFGMKV